MDRTVCGIAGLATAAADRQVDRDVLEQMTEILRHRGPDGRGLHLGPGVGLGVRRLAINDLRTGDQPIASEDGRVVLVCNGEIYNFLELRQELERAGHRFRSGSDVEVIVHLYEDLGEGCLGRLRGMFALALWDGRRRRLLLARDRLGIKPLHYALKPEGCWFGSEQKAILRAGQVDRQLDPRALRDLFDIGFVTGQQTLFTSIRRLPPAHYLLYQNGGAALHRYWQLPNPSETDRRLTADAWAERLFDKLRESVRLHLRSDVPVGAWLSPGIDSSSIAALMSQLLPEPVRTFSLTFEDPSADEVGSARMLDTFPRYALTGQRVVCGADDFALYRKAAWHTEDVSTAATSVAGLRLAQAASQSVKVVLTGEGADELFGGYPWFKFDGLTRPIGRLPARPRELLLGGSAIRGRWPWMSRLLQGPAMMGPERYRRLIGALHAEGWESLLSPELRISLPPRCTLDAGPPHPDGFESWPPLAQLQYYEFQVRLPDVIVNQLDRASMAHSVEARVPFLDHELVELCARIPVALKLRGWQEKHILRRAMRGTLPPEIVNRPKRWLSVPTSSWLRGKLPEFAAELLSHDGLRRTGYFNPTAVEQLLHRHRTDHQDRAKQLMAVLGIQLWDDLLLHGCRPQ